MCEELKGNICYFVYMVVYKSSNDLLLLIIFAATTKA